MDGNVYMSSDYGLYRFDVAANTITKVGDYNCLATSSGSHMMGSIAIDSAGNLYGTTYKFYPPGQGSGAFVRINRLDATCSFIHWTTTSGYAAGMAFMPAGLVNTTEVLVAMDNGEYFQIDPSTGSISHLGFFAGSGQQTNYLPEGGLAAVAGKSYVRVFTSNGTKKVAEFDPVQGDFVRVLGVNNFPDHSVSLFRFGGSLYTFGYKTGSADKFFRIDLATETLVALPTPAGGAALSAPSVAVAPSVP